jgi:hypothetical protein
MLQLVGELFGNVERTLDGLIHGRLVRGRRIKVAAL